MKENLDFDNEPRERPRPPQATCPECHGLHDIYSWIEEPPLADQAAIEVFGITCPKGKDFAIYYSPGYLQPADAKFYFGNATQTFTHERFLIKNFKK